MGRIKNGRVGFSKKAEKTPTIVEGDVVGVTDSEDVTMAENESKVNGQEETGIVSNTEVTEDEGKKKRELISR